MARSVEVTTVSRVAFARARDVLVDDPGAVFREVHTVGDRRQRRLAAELSVDIGAGTSVHQNVSLQLEDPRSVADGFVIPVAWRATGREHFLPAFNGELRASEARDGTCLRLEGSYTVPLGAVGRFGDDVFGQRLARRSLSALLERIAWRLESEVEWRAALANLRDPNPLDLQETQHPEIYIG
jgi:hypothetical protein